MKKIEQRNYCSTNDFVGANNLHSEAVKLFGKDWEAEDDVSQIEKLLEEVGTKHFTVTHQEYVKSDYDLEVVFSEELKEIADLKEQIRLLTATGLDALKEKHEAIRKVLIDYKCEEHGDCIVDEICEVVGILPTTEYYDEH